MALGAAPTSQRALRRPPRRPRPRRPRLRRRLRARRGARGAASTPPRERDFPLFEVPYELPFIAVTEQAFTRLVNEQYALLQRSIAAQERLQRIVLSERGLDAIVGALATLVGGTALVFDGRGEPLAQRTFRRALDDEVVDGARRRAARARPRAGERARLRARRRATSPPRALALPVAPRRRARRGAAAGVARRRSRTRGGLTEFDRLVLHQAVTVVALELLRRRVAETTERRLAGDVLSEVVARRARAAPSSRAGSSRSASASGSPRSCSPPRRPPRPLRGGAGRRAARRGRQRRSSRTPARSSCALLPGLPDDELFELAERVHARVARRARRARRRRRRARGRRRRRARAAYHEARCALEARALGGADGNGARADGIATYRDLGSFQLLLSLQDSDALRPVLRLAARPDRAGRGPLRRRAACARSRRSSSATASGRRAARRLYCHRHTLRYRIRKVEELTGRDLGQRPRPDRVLARAARAGDRSA